MHASDKSGKNCKGCKAAAVESFMEQNQRLSCNTRKQFCIGFVHKLGARDVAVGEEQAVKSCCRGDLRIRRAAKLWTLRWLTHRVRSAPCVDSTQEVTSCLLRVGCKNTTK